MTNLRNFLAIAFAAFLCVGFSSCKEDLAPRKQVINQGTIQGPGKYAPYTGPTTPLQVSFDATKTSPSPRKTKSFDVTFKQQETGDPDLMQIDWSSVPVGKKYGLLCCLRAKNEAWDESSNNANRTVITGILRGTIQMTQKNGKPVKTLHITGTMNVPQGWITPEGKFKYKDMYFGAYLLSTGVILATNSGTMYGVTFTPSSMFAVHHDDDHLYEPGPTSAPKIDMLFGIPLTRVMLDKGNVLAKAENGSEEAYPSKASDQFYHLMPAGNILHFTLRNNMAYNIRFPKTNKFWAQTCMLFNTPITFDFWKYPGNLDQMGTANCRYHISTITPGDDTYEVPINYDKIPTSRLTTENPGYITLEPGDSIDFYVWGAPATSRQDSHPLEFKIDLSKLGIELQTKDADTWVPYKESYETVTYNTSNTNKPDQLTKGHSVTKHYLSFEKTGISDPGITFAQGASYHHTFNVSSNLMIDLVGYKWDDIVNSSINDDGGRNYSNSYNYGLLQIYNPTYENVDLKNYYLARIIYNFGRVGLTDGKNIVFLSQGWDYSPYLGYTLLLPLTNVESRQSNRDMSEFTPLGYSETSPTVNYCNGNLPSNSYIAKYSSSSSMSISRLSSGKGIIIGGKGFYEAMNTTTQNLSAALNQYNIPGDSNYGTSTYAYTNLSELHNNGIIGVLGIEDGRSALANGSGQNTQFNQSPGSADSGVMSRGNGTNNDGQHNGVYLDGGNRYNYQMLNGWALIKRTPEKDGTQTFEIVDCYGPCPYNGSDETPKSNFVHNFGSSDKSPLVYVRKKTICQPNGIIMNTTAPGDPNSSWEKYRSYITKSYTFIHPVIGKVNR